MAVAEPVLRLRRHRAGAGERRGAAPGVRAHLPGRQDRGRPRCATGARSRCTATSARPIDVAQSGESYVLTTGTGSGKSLAYIVPIVDKVLRDRDARRAERRKRVRAIIVYPMNALANSQLKELEKYLRRRLRRRAASRSPSPATPARRTTSDRKKIRDNPPDILLTNYVMLELMLTRPGRPALADQDGQGPGVPRLRRAAHLPRPPGRRRGAADPPGPRGLRGRAACSASAPPPRCPARAPSPSSSRWSPTVATTLFGTDGRPGERHRRDPGPRHRPTPPTPCRPSGSRRPPPRAPTPTCVSDPLARWIETALRPRPPTRHGPPGPAAARQDRGGRRRARREHSGLTEDDVRGGDPPHPAGRLGGPAPGHRAARCSPSGCTSSCPRATPSTSPSRTRRPAT